MHMWVYTWFIYIFHYLLFDDYENDDDYNYDDEQTVVDEYRGSG